MSDALLLWIEYVCTNFAVALHETVLQDGGSPLRTQNSACDA